MPPQRYEIYDAPFELGKSVYPRPLIVIGDPCDVDGAQQVTVMPFSTKFDLFNDQTDFRVPSQSPDFGSTGLRSECFVAGEKPAWMPVTMSTRLRGRLTGTLRAEFREWIGDS